MSKRRRADRSGSHIKEKKEVIQSNEELIDDDEEEETEKEIPLPSFDSIDFSLPFLDLTSQSASRLLHPNPVCFLSTLNSEMKLNVMPISWLSPANNYGGFTFVIHKSRASATNILTKKEFMLSIAQSEQRSMILACGKVSGNRVDKFDGTIPGLKRHRVVSADNPNLNRFAVFDNDSDSDSNEEKSNEKTETATEDTLCAVSGTVANMKCTLLHHYEAADPGHWLIVAQIVEASVHPQYWDGKCFCRANSRLPPLLSFIGSQRFSFIVEEDRIQEEK